MQKIFGTDGIRGIANEWLTPEFVLQIASSFGHFLKSKQSNTPTVLIGYDTRLSSEMLEAVFTSGLLSVGVDVIRVGVLPTPGIAFLIKHYQADSGVMITASHNPYFDNGIKLFDHDGYKLSDDAQLQIEHIFHHQVVSELRNRDVGRVHDRVQEGVSDYLQFLIQAIEVPVVKLKLVIDCAHGAAYQIAPKLFETIGAEVVVINNEPDGRNINEGVGSLYLAGLCAQVLEHQADLGIAFDGDADRLIAVDEQGQIVDGDHILYTFVKLAPEILKGKPAITTVMSNLGTMIGLHKLGVEVIQSPVGDRNVVAKLKMTGSFLGTEPSGHIIIREYSTTGDGMLAALKLISLMQKFNSSLSQFRNLLQKYPQVLKNIPYPGEWKASSRLQAAIQTMQREFGEQGRILVRASGTEPIVRVMVEGLDQQQVDRYVAILSNIIESEVHAITS